MSPWPELADISISNRCSKGCSFCYRNSTPNGDLMSLDQYIQVLDQLTSPVWGPPFQVALGGGEPTEHPELIQILEETKKRQIMPNLTTNGMSLSEEHIRAFKKHCGAVAVSSVVIDSELQSNTSKLLTAGIRTNLHFVLSESSLDLAIEILRGKFDCELNGLKCSNLFDP
jgi:MoaA/NifB/PqqE/SkfB family radical SAM enzyme